MADGDPPPDAPDPGYVKLGKWPFPPASGPCTVLVKLKSEVKLDEKESDGKDDATTTNKGRKPASVTIDMTWVEWTSAGQTPQDADIRTALKDLSPRGPKSGQPVEFTHCDAELHGIASIIIKDFEGPTRELGSNKVTCKFEASSWVKPAPKSAGKAGTPTDPQQWKGGDPHQKTPPHPAPTKAFGAKDPPLPPKP